MSDAAFERETRPRVRKLTTRALCQRYDVVDRTIDRWVATGILPKPLYINNRRYWDEAEVEQHERDRMGAERTRPASRPQAASIT
jgi:predicted DNA-binding transcriptional regulator AlpA